MRKKREGPESLALVEGTQGAGTKEQLALGIRNWEAGFWPQWGGLGEKVMLFIPPVKEDSREGHQEGASGTVVDKG